MRLFQMCLLTSLSDCPEVNQCVNELLELEDIASQDTMIHSYSETAHISAHPASCSLQISNPPHISQEAEVCFPTIIDSLSKGYFLDLLLQN